MSTTKEKGEDDDWFNFGTSSFHEENNEGFDNDTNFPTTMISSSSARSMNSLSDTNNIRPLIGKNNRDTNTNSNRRIRRSSASPSSSTSPNKPLVLKKETSASSTTTVSSSSSCTTALSKKSMMSSNTMMSTSSKRSVKKVIDDSDDCLSSPPKAPTRSVSIGEQQTNSTPCIGMMTNPNNTTTPSKPKNIALSSPSSSASLSSTTEQQNNRKTKSEKSLSDKPLLEKSSSSKKSSPKTKTNSSRHDDTSAGGSIKITKMTMMKDNSSSSSIKKSSTKKSSKNSSKSISSTDSSDNKNSSSSSNKKKTSSSSGSNKKTSSKSSSETSNDNTNDNNDDSKKKKKKSTSPVQEKKKKKKKTPEEKNDNSDTSSSSPVEEKKKKKKKEEENDNDRAATEKQKKSSTPKRRNSEMKSKKSIENNSTKNHSDNRPSKLISEKVQESTTPKRRDSTATSEVDPIIEKVSSKAKIHEDDSITTTDDNNSNNTANKTKTDDIPKKIISSAHEETIEENDNTKSNDETPSNIIQTTIPPTEPKTDINIRKDAPSLPKGHNNLSSTMIDDNKNRTETAMEDLSSSSSIIDDETKTTMEDSIPSQNEINKNDAPLFIAAVDAIPNTTVSNEDQIEATTTLSKPNIVSQDNQSDKNTQQQSQLEEQPKKLDNQTTVPAAKMTMNDNNNETDKNIAFQIPPQAATTSANYQYMAAVERIYGSHPPLPPSIMRDASNVSQQDYNQDNASNNNEKEDTWSKFSFTNKNYYMNDLNTAYNALQQQQKERYYTQQQGEMTTPKNKAKSLFAPLVGQLSSSTTQKSNKKSNNKRIIWKRDKLHDAFYDEELSYEEREERKCCYYFYFRHQKRVIGFICLFFFLPAILFLTLSIQLVSTGEQQPIQIDNTNTSIIDLNNNVAVETTRANNTSSITESIVTPSSSPTLSTVSPTVATIKPTVTTINPTTSPTLATSAPTISSSSPTISSSSPTLTTSSPTLTTSIPTISSSSPVTSSSSPTILTSDPTTSSSTPTTSSSSPTILTSTPTTLTINSIVPSSSPTTSIMTSAPPLPSQQNPTFVGLPPSNITVGAYYYPWQGDDFHGGNYLRKHLNQQPYLGEYDDSNPQVIAKHLEWSRQANIRLWITSWWGPNGREDKTTKDVILTHTDLLGSDHKVALFYETTGRITKEDDYSLERIEPDIEYISTTYFDHPNYYRIDGRPVLFIYLPRKLEILGTMQDAISRIRSTATSQGYNNLFLIGVHVWQHPPSSGSTANNVDFPPFSYLDALTNYDVYGSMIGKSMYAGQDVVADYYEKQRQWKVQANDNDCGYIPAVTPGYNDRGIRLDANHLPLSRKLTNNDDKEGSFFASQLEYATNLVDYSTNNLLLVNSFNEWHEDTQIEPAVDATTTTNPKSQEYTNGVEYQGYGELYLNLLRNATSSTTTA